ncbi:hypothetical protein ACET3X_001182 [Alternaria dauci]|uniref:Uncharacterized protein n=1 Tax=Alternaria dauci TaxID=48095 RepID=A0ABR3UXL5_9PLEO
MLYGLFMPDIGNSAKLITLGSAVPACKRTNIVPPILYPPFFDIEGYLGWLVTSHLSLSHLSTSKPWRACRRLQCQEPRATFHQQASRGLQPTPR